MPETPTPASPLEALKAGFRRACVRRLVGDEDGAIEVLRDDIPSLVVNWAKSSSLEPSEKKAKLKEEKSLKKAAEKAEVERAVEIVLGPEQSEHITSEEATIESQQQSSDNGGQSLGNHEWLVE